MAISPRQIIQFTPRSVLYTVGFSGRRIEWRYFELNTFNKYMCIVAYMREKTMREEIGHNLKYFLSLLLSFRLQSRRRRLFYTPLPVL